MTRDQGWLLSVTGRKDNHFRYFRWLPSNATWAIAESKSLRICGCFLPRPFRPRPEAWNVATSVTLRTFRLNPATVVYDVTVTLSRRYSTSHGFRDLHGCSTPRSLQTLMWHNQPYWLPHITRHCQPCPLYCCARACQESLFLVRFSLTDSSIVNIRKQRSEGRMRRLRRGCDP